MNIALIRRRFSPIGGGELYLQRLIDALLAQGHSIELLSESWNTVPREGIRYHTIPTEKSRARRAISFAEHVRHTLSTLQTDCVFSLERTLKQDIYRAGDGVHKVWLQHQKAFAPWWKKPFCGRDAHHRHVLSLERQTFDPANTRFVIANSPMVRDEILQNFPFPAERIRLIPNGVALKKFENLDRAVARTRFGLDPSDFVLLFVGSGWERKGLRFTIQLLRDLRAVSQDFPAPFRSIKLLVVGKGRVPLWRDPDVIYTGPLRDVEAAYAAANLLAFLPIYDPAANVVTEALAAGLPVLTTSTNGAAHWIENGRNGHVLESPTHRSAILQAALHWMRQPPIAPPSESLSMERNVADTLALMNQI